MCWVTTNLSAMKEHRASGDMRVYKVLYIKKNRFGKTRLVSPLMGFRYKPGKTYHAELGITKTAYSLIIMEGLHCFDNIARAGEYADNLMKTVVIVPAIIPEGTRYYMNESMEIVTEKLKIML